LKYILFGGAKSIFLYIDTETEFDVNEKFLSLSFLNQSVLKGYTDLKTLLLFICQTILLFILVLNESKINTTNFRIYSVDEMYLLQTACVNKKARPLRP
jgi:hypothetical protein